MAPSAQVKDSRLGPWTEVQEGAVLVETTLGAYSYVMENCQLIYATLGRFCSIAAHAAVGPPNHPMARAAQHHFTYRSNKYGFGPDDDGFFDVRRERSVELGHDVWIGFGGRVLPGVRVGTGAVVGASAVVTRDVAPYTIVAGVPARPLRERFSRDIQESLLRIRWWDWPPEALKAAMPDFRGEIEAFVEKYDTI